jgi:hypothetical protein
MTMATRTDAQSPALHVDQKIVAVGNVQRRREQPDNITQWARCPSLFTGVPRRGILRTSLVRSSSKFAKKVRRHGQLADAPSYAHALS